MLNTTAGPPVTRLGLVNDMLLKESNTTCLDYKYEKMVADMKKVSWDSETAKGSRQWTYQTCHEFGFYQTSENKEDIFGDRFGIDYLFASAWMCSLKIWTPSSWIWWCPVPTITMAP